MSYTELLDRFWGEERNLSFLEVALYFYLLHRCNSVGWPDTFSVSNEDLMQTLKCSRNTVRAAQRTLVDESLICINHGVGRGSVTLYSIVTDDIKKGQIQTPFIEKKGSNSDPFFNKKGQSQTPFISVSDLKPENGENAENEKGSISDPFSAQLKTEEKKQTKKKPLPAPTKKEKNKEKKKENALPLSGAHTHTCVQTEINFKDLKTEPLRKKREPREPILPKNMQEVLSFFETNGRELQDWKADAEAFFYHFDSVGWMGTSNRKIIDWKSRAHLWIADKIVKEKQQALRTNGATTNQPGSTRESRLNDAVGLINELLRENELEG